MNVIHIVPAVSNEASGPSYSVMRLCESLIDAGTGVTLAALDWEPINGSPAYLRTFPLGIGPRRLGRSPAMARWLDAEALSGRVVLLHNHGMWQMNAVYPGQVAARCNIPFVVSPRGAWSEWAMTNGSYVKKPFWSLVQLPSLSSVTCFHATASNEYEDIRRLGFRQPVAIIPNGIDIPPPLNKSTGGMRTLLFLGRIHPVKGLDMLLPAWGAVQARFPDWRLRIVGSDDGYYGISGYLDKMRRLSEQLGLQRIEFAGALHGDAKWKAYTDADIFVLSTYSENFGMSVAEALAAGTPAIVSKGAPWAGLESIGSGWWIDIGVDPLVKCLNEAMAYRSEDLALMGSRGRDWMLREYSWSSVGSKMSITYRWLKNRSEPRPAWVLVE